MYKGIYNGIVMEFVAGYVEEDNETFRVHWYLTHPDDNNSKNEIHIESTQQVRTTFYNNNGILYYKTPTIKDSLFYRWTKYRGNSGALDILDEYITYPNIPGLENLVTFRIRA